MILEKALPNWKSQVQRAGTYLELAAIIKILFNLDAALVPGQEPPKGPNDYKDENSDYGLKVKGIKARERLNEQAREIIDRVKDPGALTEADRAVLMQYSGRGGLTENSQFEYYTPTHVAEGVWDALRVNGFENGNVLDPCVGAGVFSATKPKGSAIITGVDIDPTGSRVAQLLNPEDMIQTKSLERLAIETPDGTFDAVVSNVPFGSARGASAHDDPAYKDEKRIEKYFILRTLDKLRPGGLCCLIVPINIVGAKGTNWERFRIACSKKAEFLGAHKLPSKTFKDQGTDTVVDIVVFKKHPKDLLDRMETIPFEALQTASVVWAEFVQGKYWLGEGRRFIMGQYVPKVEGDRWSRETVDSDIDNAGLKAKLAQRFNSRIDWDALEAVEPIVRNYANGDRKMINGAEFEMMNGAWQKVIASKGGDAMTIDAEKYGVGTIAELKGKLSTPKGALGLTSSQVFAAYKAFPDMLTPLQRAAIEFAMSQAKEEYQEQLYRGAIIGGMIARYHNSVNDGVAEETERPELQEMVLQELATYGHPKNNRGLTLTGESSKMFGLFKNAIDEKGQFSDLLAGTLEGSGRTLEYDSTNIQGIVEHLVVREGFGAVELEDVQKLYTGKRNIASLGDLAEDENIAITPDGIILPMQRYCAGDIYPKIQAMADAMALETDDRIKNKYMAQIETIMGKRKVTAGEDIVFGLRNKWFSRKYMVEFLRECGYKNLSYGRKEEITGPSPYDGKEITRTKYVEDFDEPFGRFEGIEGGGFSKQFLSYLNGGNVTSSGEDAQERIAEYKRQCQSLEERFNVWMQQNADISEVAEQYNRRFNAYIPFEHEGTDLGLKDVSPQVRLHNFQNSAVRRLSEDGRGILAHNVGLGKTFAALALYSYNKQMGRSKKTCIVVPKSVLGNWYQESKKFLGQHEGVLFVGFEPKRGKDGQIVQETVKDEQGEPKINPYTKLPEYQDVLVERNAKEDVYDALWKIPQGNHSLVIMTKEKFGMIPMRPETKKGYTDKMVSRSLISAKNAEKVVSGGAADEKGGKISYSEDVAKTHLEQQFSDEGTAKKGEFPYFEDMGFTDVITDECHQYKNNFEGGEQTSRIAYLPTAPAAKIALDMTMKMAHLRDANNGRGVYMLSATPVTNSPLEIYNMLSYVCPLEEFERFGVYTVDDFVRVFGEIGPIDKTMVSGNIATVDGLLGFQNLDGLRNLFHKYVNMKSASDFPDQIKLPPFEEINEEGEMTEAQQDIYVTLRERAAESAKSKGKKTGSESMFSIIRDMDRVTTDMDLYNRTMTFIFPGQNKTVIDDLLKGLPQALTVKRMLNNEELEEAGIDLEAGHGKAQDVTIKLEYSVKLNNEGYVVIVPQAYEDIIVTRLPATGIPMSEVSHPLMPKYAKLIENLRVDLEASGKQLVFTEEKTQHQKILRLIVHHIPTIATMIGVINADEAKGTELQKIVDSYNGGNLKIVICNKKAEVGVNLQKGTTAIHHLTFPWTPASIQQRNGRGVRQGNTAAHINIYYYCGKGSFDAYRLEVLQKKSNWMNELFSGSDVRADNANALDQDELVDMLEADPVAAKARRMERLAAKQAESKERERKQLANYLQVLASATGGMKGLDAEKEAEREKLTSRIPELEQEIKNIQARGLALAEDDPLRASMGGKIIDKQRTLKNAQGKLANLDQEYDNRRAKLDSTIKQTSGLLRQKAKKEGLPFSEALIDHPENACVTFDGGVVAVGDCYESKYYRNEKNIMKITAVDSAKRAFQYDMVVGGNIFGMELLKDAKTGGTVWKWYTANSISTQVKENSLLKVSYSEKEISVLKALDKEWKYDDLIKGNFDQETFLEHRGAMQWARYGDSYVIRDASGKLAFSEYGPAPIGESIVYPAPSNEDFRKGVCEAYLELKRADGGYSGTMSRVGSTMFALFGSRWEELSLEYGKQATESEILTICARAWKATEDEYLDSGGILANIVYGNDITRIVSGAFAAAREEAGKLGDNAEFIRSVIKGYFAGVEEKISAELAVKQAENARQEAEKLKTLPGYKEVPADVATAFLGLGITVKTNTNELGIPGVKGGRTTYAGAFSRWFFQDKNGMNGNLFKIKDILKARYGAQFFKDAGPNFTGAWWHVTSTADLKQLYKLLAA